MPRLSTHKITVELEPTGARISVTGREAWLLKNLMDVGERGLTSIERPAPRIAAYVANLREAGLNISTEMEEHRGPYPGRHGRYRLQSKVQVVSIEGLTV